jgi:hypothetical protein
MYSSPSRSRRDRNSATRIWGQKSEDTKSFINPLKFRASGPDDVEFCPPVEVRRWMKVQVKSLEDEKLAS